MLLSAPLCQWAQPQREPSAAHKPLPSGTTAGEGLSASVLGGAWGAVGACPSATAASSRAASPEVLPPLSVAAAPGVRAPVPQQSCIVEGTAVDICLRRMTTLYHNAVGVVCEPDTSVLECSLSTCCSLPHTIEAGRRPLFPHPSTRCDGTSWGEVFNIACVSPPGAADVMTSIAAGSHHDTRTRPLRCKQHAHCPCDTI